MEIVSFGWTEYKCIAQAQTGMQAAYAYDDWAWDVESKSRKQMYIYEPILFTLHYLLEQSATDQRCQEPARPYSIPC